MFLKPALNFNSQMTFLYAIYQLTLSLYYTISMVYFIVYLFHIHNTCIQIVILYLLFCAGEVSREWSQKLLAEKFRFHNAQADRPTLATRPIQRADRPTCYYRGIGLYRGQTGPLATIGLYTQRADSRVECGNFFLSDRTGQLTKGQA